MADETTEPDPTLSRDARHSTYSENTDAPNKDDNPPPGPSVIQELGKPKEEGEPKSSKTSTKSTSSS